MSNSQFKSNSRNTTTFSGYSNSLVTAAMDPLLAFDGENGLQAQISTKNFLPTVAGKQDVKVPPCHLNPNKN